VHASSDEKSYDSKDSCYEELEQFSVHFPTYHTKILLGDFNAKVRKENIFIPTMGTTGYIRIVMIMVLEL